MKNSNVRRGAHWMILSLLLAAGGCGGDPTGNGNNNGNNNGGTTPPVLTNAVNVVDFDFTPPNIQVAGGSTVTWTWAGVVGHNVTFGATSGIANQITQITGTHSAVMPTAAGTYTYQCTIHPLQMQGSVLVP